MSSKVLREDVSPLVSSLSWINVSGESAGTAISYRTAAADRDQTSSAHLIELNDKSRAIAQLERQLAEMEAEIPLRMEQARQSGFREGEAAGASRMSATVDPMMQKLARSVADAASFRSQFRRESEQELVKLSMAIARKVLHRELTIDPHALLGLIKATLDELNVNEIHRLRIAAADASAVRTHLDRLGLPQAVEVIADPALERGSVLFETVRGAIDAGLQTQLAEIERGFADLLEGRRA